MFGRLLAVFALLLASATLLISAFETIYVFPSLVSAADEGTRLNVAMRYFPLVAPSSILVELVSSDALSAVPSATLDETTATPLSTNYGKAVPATVLVAAPSSLSFVLPAALPPALYALSITVDDVTVTLPAALTVTAAPTPFRLFPTVVFVAPASAATTMAASHSSREDLVALALDVPLSLLPAGVDLITDAALYDIDVAFTLPKQANSAAAAVAATADMLTLPCKSPVASALPAWQARVRVACSVTRPSPKDAAAALAPTAPPLTAALKVTRRVNATAVAADQTADVSAVDGSSGEVVLSLSLPNALSLLSRPVLVAAAPHTLLPTTTLAPTITNNNDDRGDTAAAGKATVALHFQADTFLGNVPLVAVLYRLGPSMRSADSVGSTDSRVVAEPDPSITISRAIQAPGMLVLTVATVNTAPGPLALVFEASDPGSATPRSVTLLRIDSYADSAGPGVLTVSEDAPAAPAVGTVSAMWPTALPAASATVGAVFTLLFESALPLASLSNSKNDDGDVAVCDPASLVLRFTAPPPAPAVDGGDDDGMGSVEVLSCSAHGLTARILVLPHAGAPVALCGFILTAATATAAAAASEAAVVAPLAFHPYLTSLAPPPFATVSISAAHPALLAAPAATSAPVPAAAHAWAALPARVTVTLRGRGLAAVAGVAVYHRGRLVGEVSFALVSAPLTSAAAAAAAAAASADAGSVETAVEVTLPTKGLTAGQTLTIDLLPTPLTTSFSTVFAALAETEADVETAPGCRRWCPGPVRGALRRLAVPEWLASIDIPVVELTPRSLLPPLLRLPQPQSQTQTVTATATTTVFTVNFIKATRGFPFGLRVGNCASATPKFQNSAQQQKLGPSATYTEKGDIVAAFTLEPTVASSQRTVSNGAAVGESMVLTPADLSACAEGAHPVFLTMPDFYYYPVTASADKVSAAAVPGWGHDAVLCPLGDLDLLLLPPLPQVASEDAEPAKPYLVSMSPSSGLVSAPPQGIILSTSGLFGTTDAYSVTFGTYRMRITSRGAYYMRLNFRNATFVAGEPLQLTIMYRNTVVLQADNVFTFTNDTDAVSIAEARHKDARASVRVPASLPLNSMRQSQVRNQRVGLSGVSAVSMFPPWAVADGVTRYFTFTGPGLSADSVTAVLFINTVSRRTVTGVVVETSVQPGVESVTVEAAFPNSTKSALSDNEAETEVGLRMCWAATRCGLLFTSRITTPFLTWTRTLTAARLPLPSMFVLSPRITFMTTMTMSSLS